MNEIRHNDWPYARLLSIALLFAVLLSALTIVGGMPAAALAPNVSEPYPQTPGSTSNMTIVSTVESGDTIAQNGVSQVRVNMSGPAFDGSISNINASDVEVFINRKGGGTSQTVAAKNVQKSDDARLSATLSRSLSVAPGDEVVVRLRGMSNPSTAGERPLNLTLGNAAGQTDGPISVPYRLITPQLNFSDQSVNANGSQTVTLTGTTPDRGYIGIYTVQDGNIRDLVGVGTTEPNYHQQRYNVEIDIDKGQQLRAVLYYETTGDNLGERKQASFNKSDDARVLDNGQSITADAFVERSVPTRKIDSGSKIIAGQQIRFSDGEPESEYIVEKVKDKRAAIRVRSFTTNSSGYATINTTNFTTGNYAILATDGRDIVNLDEDGLTSPVDDSFRVRNPEQERNTTVVQANASSDGDDSDGGFNVAILFFGGMGLFVALFVGIFIVQYRRINTR